MKNLEHYRNLIRLLSARLEEMKEEKTLIKRLVSLYSKRIEELELDETTD